MDPDAAKIEARKKYDAQRKQRARKASVQTAASLHAVQNAATHDEEDGGPPPLVGRTQVRGYTSYGMPSYSASTTSSHAAANQSMLLVAPNAQLAPPPLPAAPPRARESVLPSRFVPSQNASQGVPASSLTALSSATSARSALRVSPPRQTAPTTSRNEVRLGAPGLPRPLTQPPATRDASHSASTAQADTVSVGQSSSEDAEMSGNAPLLEELVEEEFAHRHSVSSSATAVASKKRSRETLSDAQKIDKAFYT